MTYRFIEEHKDQWPVRWLCQTLEVSPAGYYAWQQCPRSAREQRRDALVVEIRAIHAEVKARYGSPRIHAELVDRGHGCCVNTVAKLMQEAGIAAKTARKFRCTTDSNHDLPVADNLLDRQFDPEAPNESWVADITYIPTQEGWLYLAVVEDLYSRRVVGWSMADRMASRLVVDALALAVERRLPEGGIQSPWRARFRVPGRPPDALQRLGLRPGGRGRVGTRASSCGERQPSADSRTAASAAATMNA